MRGFVLETDKYPEESVQLAIVLADSEAEAMKKLGLKKLKASGYVVSNLHADEGEELLLTELPII